MYLGLRQICLVAADKSQTVADLEAVLDVRPVHGSGDLSAYGLPARGPMSEGGRTLLAAQGVENLVFGAGASFLEVIFPLRPDATAARYLARRGGDTGYMLIFQSDHVERFAELARAEGVRIVHEANFPIYQDIHLHTRDTGGTLLSVARHLPENRAGGSWYPAGTAWETMAPSSRVTAIVGIELQSPNPETLAQRWGRLLGLEVRSVSDGYAIALDDGEIRFAPARDGRGEGFSGFDVMATDPVAIRAAALSRGLTVVDDIISICGMRCRLIA